MECDVGQRSDFTIPNDINQKKKMGIDIVYETYLEV